MIKKILGCLIPILGSCFDHIPPAQAQKEDPSILYRLKGIVFLNDWNLVRPNYEVEGVVSNGVEVLNEYPGFLEDLQEEYVGKPLTEQTIQRIKHKVMQFYESHHQSLMVVNTPKQSFSNGVLQLVVTESVLGEIRCKGNEYVYSEHLKKYIQAKPGSAISTKELLRDLAFMNSNPFRRTDVVLTPGKKPGVVDLELLTVDRWPYRFYVGADNTGTISTERNRIFFGVNLGKTIVEDSEVSYQYTTAPNGNRYFSHTLMTRYPLPWVRHILQAFGGYAHVEPEKESSWKSNGKSWEVGLRYRIPIFGGTGAMQEVVLGYDFKELGSHARLTKTDRFRGLADVSQFMVGYNLGVRDCLRKVTLNLELFASPSHMSTQNDERAYRHLQRGTDPQYVYLKGVHSFLQEIQSGWRFSYNITGQVSSASLLPTEQVTMTGYNGVRGFEERILNLDNALLINLTVEAPHFSPAYWMGWAKRYDDLSFFLFFDTGFGRDHHVRDGQSSLPSLGSIGPGMRYELSRYASAHLEYGFQLWHNGFESITDSRYNFGIILSY